MLLICGTIPFSKQINDVAVVESGPHVVDTKQAYIIVRHVKFSTKKSGKKAIKALDAVQQSPVPNLTGTVNSSIQDEMPHQAEEWELAENGSETESEDLSDQDKSIREPLHHKPLPVLDTSSSDMDVNKEQTTLKSVSGFVPLKSEPSVVEVNRYAKQSEPKRFQQNRERMPHQAARNEGHVQFDPKQRQFNNSSNPSSPPSSFGRGPASNPRSSAPSFGNFSSSRQVLSKDQPNLGANGDKPRIPSPIFSSSSKTVSSSEQRNSKEGTMDHTRNPNSPTRNYGIFSSTQPVGSRDQSSTNSTVQMPGNASDPSSPIQSYGIFSATKPVGSGDQKSSKDATENKPGSASSARSSYGIFSKSKAGSSGA